MKVIEKQERIGVPTAATIGMFDGVHCGHRSVIAFLREEARSRGYESAVITFTNHPRQVLCPECDLKLLMEPQDKVAALSATGVDYVVTIDFDKELAALSAYDFIRLIASRYGVRLLVIGYDHRFGHNPSDCFEDYVAYGKEAGVEVLRAPELESGSVHVSSSAIRHLLEKGAVAEAGRLLSHRYTLGGIVVAGQQNGRRIGFPTANIDVSSSPLVIPANGVYAVCVKLPDGTQRGGMLNIGTRPTVSDGGDRTVEVNIFGFSGNLYGSRLSVGFVDKVREERRMDGLEALRRQLESDRQQVKEILKQSMI